MSNSADERGEIIKLLEQAFALADSDATMSFLNVKKDRRSGTGEWLY